MAPEKRNPRNRRGRWRKGVSGNPAGKTTAANMDVAALARDYTTFAIKTLRRIARDKNAATGARVMACKELLDRGHGRPASNMLELTQQAKGIRSHVTIEFVRAKDGRPVPSDLPLIDDQPTKTAQTLLRLGPDFGRARQCG
jgi:hypothetical protein